MFVHCRGIMWGVDDGGVRNNTLACCSASLMILGACLYVIWKSSRVSMAIVSLFWICGSVVILYM